MRTQLLLAAMLLMVSGVKAQDATPPSGQARTPGMRGPMMHHEFAGRGTEMLPMGTWWRNPDMVAKVGLTADQVKHIDQIFTDSKAQLIQMHAAMEEEQVRLDAAMNATPFDQNLAQTSSDRIADLRASLEKANARMLLGIRAVLTPEQWTKLQGAHHWQHGDKPGRGPGPAAPGGTGL